MTDFSEAYKRFLPPLKAKCRRMLGNSSAADDVAQETFLRLWKSNMLHDATDVRSVMAWLYRTSTRLSIDLLRDRRPVESGTVDDLSCNTDPLACTQARRLIEALAHSVPEEELAVAILCRVDGLGHAEAGMVLGVSERTVRRRLDLFDGRTRVLRTGFLP